MEHVKIRNIKTSSGKGRIGATIFQRNGVIRTDKRYMTKKMLKKLAKERD
jgi:hypothetical protein